MGDIVTLPTAPASYYTIRRFGQGWGVFIVTPIGAGKPLATRIAQHACREGAHAHANMAAVAAARPFKARG